MVRGAGSNLGQGGQLLKKGQFVLLTNKQKSLNLENCLSLLNL
jgi:hypothetical protein